MPTGEPIGDMALGDGLAMCMSDAAAMTAAFNRKRRCEEGMRDAVRREPGPPVGRKAGVPVVDPPPPLDAAAGCMCNRTASGAMTPRGVFSGVTSVEGELPFTNFGAGVDTLRANSADGLNSGSVRWPRKNGEVWIEAVKAPAAGVGAVAGTGSRLLVGGDGTGEPDLEPVFPEPDEEAISMSLDAGDARDALIRPGTTRPAAAAALPDEDGMAWKDLPEDESSPRPSGDEMTPFEDFLGGGATR